MRFAAAFFDETRAPGTVGNDRGLDGASGSLDHEGESDQRDRRARLAAVADQLRPVMLAREHTLPLVAPLTPLFPEGALRRGITVAVAGDGATSLAIAVAVAPVRAGSWAVFVDLPECNLAAAAESGLELERVACIRSGTQWAAAVAATLGAFDLVIVGLASRVRAADVRRLGARARERGTVIVVVQTATAVAGALWPEAPDVTLTATGSRWVGLGVGHGHLRARTVEVVAEGRRSFARPRRAEISFPADAPPLGVPLAGLVPQVGVAPVGVPPVDWPVVAHAG